MTTTHPCEWCGGPIDRNDPATATVTQIIREKALSVMQVATDHRIAHGNDPMCIAVATEEGYYQ